MPCRTVPVGLNPEGRSDFGHSKGHVGLRLGLVSSAVEGYVLWGTVGGLSPCGEGGG